MRLRAATALDHGYVVEEDGEPTVRRVRIEAGAVVQRRDLPGLSDEAWQGLLDAGSLISEDEWQARKLDDEEARARRFEQIANNPGSWAALDM